MAESAPDAVAVAPNGGEARSVVAVVMFRFVAANGVSVYFLQTSSAAPLAASPAAGAEVLMFVPLFGSKRCVCLFSADVTCCSSGCFARRWRRGADVCSAFWQQTVCLFIFCRRHLLLLWLLCQPLAQRC